jgi:hypothetical protein
VCTHGKAFDLVAEGEESLSGQVKAVVCLQLAYGDVDEDVFLEIEQLESGQGVSLTVDGAQLVARKCELGSSLRMESETIRRSSFLREPEATVA